MTPAQQLAKKKANRKMGKDSSAAQFRMKEESDAAYQRNFASRRDAAGRSGMGEDAFSNISYKVNTPNGGRFYKAALRTGNRASQDAGGRGDWRSTDAGRSSVVGAHRYAYDRKQSLNPRRDNSGYGNAGFGASRNK